MYHLNFNSYTSLLTMAVTRSRFPDLLVSQGLTANSWSILIKSTYLNANFISFHSSISILMIQRLCDTMWVLAPHINQQFYSHLHKPFIIYSSFLILISQLPPLPIVMHKLNSYLELLYNPHYSNSYCRHSHDCHKILVNHHAPRLSFCFSFFDFHLKLPVPLSHVV